LTAISHSDLLPTKQQNPMDLEFSFFFNNLDYRVNSGIYHNYTTSVTLQL